MSQLSDIVVAAPIGFVVGLLFGLRVARYQRPDAPPVREVLVIRDYSGDRDVRPRP